MAQADGDTFKLEAQSKLIAKLKGSLEALAEDNTDLQEYAKTLRRQVAGLSERLSEISAELDRANLEKTQLAEDKARLSLAVQEQAEQYQNTEAGESAVRESETSSRALRAMRKAFYELARTAAASGIDVVSGSKGTEAEATAVQAQQDAMADSAGPTGDRASRDPVGSPTFQGSSALAQHRAALGGRAAEGENQSTGGSSSAATPAAPTLPRAGASAAAGTNGTAAGQPSGAASGGSSSSTAAVPEQGGEGYEEEDEEDDDDDDDEGGILDVVMAPPMLVAAALTTATDAIFGFGHSSSEQQQRGAKGSERGSRGARSGSNQGDRTVLQL